MNNRSSATNSQNAKLPLGYCVARWLLNRWLRQNPRRVVPIIEELHKFAETKLTVQEYKESVEAWEYLKTENEILENNP